MCSHYFCPNVLSWLCPKWEVLNWDHMRQHAINHDKQKASKRKHGDSESHLSHQLALAFRISPENRVKRSKAKADVRYRYTLQELVSAHDSSVFRAALSQKGQWLQQCKSLRMKTYEKIWKQRMYKTLVASTLLRSTIQMLCYLKENVKVKLSHFRPSDDCVW